MPVPLYGAAQVPVDPIQPVRQEGNWTAGNSGGGANEAAQTVGDAVAAVYQDKRAKADQLAVLDADLKASEAQNRLLYAPDTGYLRQMGKNAFGLPGTAQASFDQELNGISASLATPEQRAMFARFSMTRRAEFDGSITRHVGDQTTAFDNERTQAYLTNATNDAVNGFNDPPTIAANIERAKLAILSNGQRNGVPADVIKMQATHAISDIHLGVIDQMVNTGQPEKADAYLNGDGVRRGVVGDLSAQDAVKAQRVVELGLVKGESQRNSDQIMVSSINGAPLDPLGNKDLVSAQELANQQVQGIQKPAVRAATQELVNQAFTQARDHQRQRADQDFNDTIGILERTGGDMSQVPTDQLARLGMERLDKAREHAVNLQQGKWNPGDEGLYQELHLMGVADASRADFAKLNLNDYPRLNREQKSKLGAEQAEALDKEQQLGPLLKQAKINEETIQTLFGQANPPLDYHVSTTVGGTTTYNQDAIKLRAALDAAVVADQMKLGRPVTPEETMDIGKRIFVSTANIKGPGIFWSGSKAVPAGLAPNAENMAYGLGRVPEDFQRKMITSWRLAGKTPTTDEIIAQYNASLGPDGPKVAPPAAPGAAAVPPVTPESEEGRSLYSAMSGL